MPATLQPVIVTPSLPLLLAFYKALLGAVEISRMPEDGPAFYGACRSATPNSAWWPMGMPTSLPRSGSCST